MQFVRNGTKQHLASVSRITSEIPTLAVVPSAFSILTVPMTRLVLVKGASHPVQLGLVEPMLIAVLEFMWRVAFVSTKYRIHAFSKL
jgi:hypothetical protein